MSPDFNAEGERCLPLVPLVHLVMANTRRCSLLGGVANHLVYESVAFYLKLVCVSDVVFGTSNHTEATERDVGGWFLQAWKWFWGVVGRRAWVFGALYTARGAAYRVLEVNVVRSFWTDELIIYVVLMLRAWIFASRVRFGFDLRKFMIATKNILIECKTYLL